MSGYVSKMVSVSNAMPADKKVRRYGFELESPSVASFASDFEDIGFTMSHDGSVETPDCNCNCSECEHDCNCDNCSISNGWDEVDHCQDCKANEAQSPITYLHRPEAYARVLRDAKDSWAMPSTYNDENWSNHIHIEARDLTLAQIYAVQKLGHKAGELLPDLFDRDYNRFALELTPTMLAEVKQGYTDKFQEVNIEHVLKYRHYAERRGYTEEQLTAYEVGHPAPHLNSEKSTIEFRLFNTTADPEIIFARVALCRAIVATAKKSGLYWALSAETPERFLTAIEYGRH